MVQKFAVKIEVEAVLRHATNGKPLLLPFLWSEISFFGEAPAEL